MATTPKTSNTEPFKVKLKLVIDKRANRVLFAEAGKDFMDILFNLLYLPFATVTRHFRNAGMVSCTNNLYQSLENLNEAYLLDSQNKVELLKPLLKCENASVLLQPLACPQPIEKKFYNCPNNHRFVTNEYNIKCSQCTYGTTTCEVQLSNTGSDKDVGIVKKLFTYMVTDDLSVTPVSMISGIALLQSKAVDIGDLEDRVVEIGTDEVLELLKVSLKSNAALTTVFLKDEFVTMI